MSVVNEQLQTAHQAPRRTPLELSGKVKIAARPYPFTRPSNEDVTNLRFTAQQQTTESLPETPIGLTPVVSQQREERMVMSSSFPSRNLWRIIASCIWSVSGGFSDAAPGALLPSIEAAYGINYAVVSLIWMLNAAGFILVAVLSHKIQP